MSFMEVGVLGELRVTDVGTDRTPRGQRSRDLLAVLALRHGQPIDAGALLDLVWGDGAIDLGASVVHTQIARVRRAVGNELVEKSDAGYRLVGVTTDADEFVESVQRARSVRRVDQALGILDQALGLWRADDAYADVSEHLVETEIVRLRELRTDALELRAELLLAVGGDDAARQALEVADVVIERAPLRERGHELSMSASWRLGRQAEALAAFDRLRLLLREELGVDPGATARDLQARMLAQDPSLMETGHPVLEQPTAAVPSAPATRLIGRDADRALLSELLTERRVVTLVGPGGVGKSRLLADLHQRTVDQRPTTYVDLSTEDDLDAEQLAEHVARALGLTLGAGSAEDVIIAALSDRDALLLIDEAERNLPATARLCSAIVRRCARVSIVVSSRRALDVVGEVALPVGPLACPARDAEAEAIARSPAVQLLRERIADHAPGVDLSDRLDLLSRIARRVDGLPLALEIVAGHVRTRPVEDLDSVLADPLSLTAVEVDRPERHRSLGDVVRWSVDRIPEQQAAALRRLGVFSGPFSMKAGCAVIGTADAEPLLRALVRECLVHMDRSGDLFTLRLLRPVRDLALAQLEGSEEESARGRHRRWYAERWRGALRSDSLLFDLRDHYSDYVSALDSALGSGDGRAAADLMLTLGRLWSYTDMLRTGMRWSERVLDSGLIDQVQASRVRTIRSTLLFHHDPQRVRDELSTAIAVLTDADDAVWLTTAHLVAALERSDSGDEKAALEHGRLAVAASRRSTEERQADALGALAVAALVEAPQEAEQAAREAWALARRSGSSAAISSVAANVSWALIGLGRPEDARDVLAETVMERSRIVADVVTLLDPDAMPTFLRINLAWCDLLVSNPAGAIHGFADAIVALPEAVEDRMGAEIFLGAGAALADLDDPRAAELLAGAASLVERTSLSLLPWQEKLLARAVERSGGGERWSWGSDQVSGGRLAALVRAGAGHAHA
jgi:predicted ATPase/DNA-binding SARP family transcriptional activator